MTVFSLLLSTASLFPSYAGADGALRNNAPVAVIGSPPDGSILEVGTNITFNGSGSYDREGEIVNWSWSFGEFDCVCFGSIYTYAYSIPANYTVFLTVTDDNNGTATASIELTITASEGSILVTTGMADYHKGQEVNFFITNTGNDTLTHTSGGTEYAIKDIEGNVVFEEWDSDGVITELEPRGTMWAGSWRQLDSDQRQVPPGTYIVEKWFAGHFGNARFDITNESSPILVTTDKEVYRSGENVSIFMTNTGNETLRQGDPGVRYTIRDAEGNIIYDLYPEQVPQVVTELPPNATWHVGDWPQINSNDTQVPPGRYVVETGFAGESGLSDFEIVFGDGAIQGRVFEEDNLEPLFNATVKLSTVRGVWFTDGDGFFHIGNLISTNYDWIEVSKDGYETVRWYNISVAEGRETWVGNITLPWEQKPDNYPPEVNFLSPEDGDAVSGTITIEGLAMDLDVDDLVINLFAKESQMGNFTVKDGPNEDEYVGCFFLIRAVKNINIDPSKYTFWVSEKGYSPKRLDFSFRDYTQDENMTPLGGDRNASYRYDDAGKSGRWPEMPAEDSSERWTDGEYLGFDMPRHDLGIYMVNGDLFEVFIKSPTNKIIFRDTFLYKGPRNTRAHEDENYDHSGSVTIIDNMTVAGSKNGTYWTYSWKTSGVPNGGYSLTVWANDGKVSSAPDQVKITVENELVPPPLAAVASCIIKDGNHVYFDASNSSGFGDGVVYEWDFGDGSTGKGVTTHHTYTEPGSYTVVLLVSDAHGNSASVTLSVSIRAERPNAAPFAIMDHHVNGTIMVFDGSGSYDTDGVIRDHCWSLGDGSRSTGEIITHEYARPGIYLVVLTVTDDDGASSSARAVVSVGFREGNVAGIIGIDGSSPNANVSYIEEGLSLALAKVEDDRLVIEVEGSFRESKVIAVNLGGGALPVMEVGKLVVLFDGTLMETAGTGDVLAATGADPLYCFLDLDGVLQLLVYIPHFSAHTITIATDNDMDRTADFEDAFPDDAAASIDRDGDGYPDRWNTGKTASDSTTGLTIDEYPDDERQWKRKTVGRNPAWLLIILTVVGVVVLVLVVIITAVVLYSRKREKYYEDYLASEDMEEDEADRVVPGTGKKGEWDEFFYED